MVNPHNEKLPEKIVTSQGVINHPTIKQVKEFEIDKVKGASILKKKKYQQKLRFACDAMKNYVDRCKTELARLPKDEDMKIAVSCFDNLGLYVDEVANVFNANAKHNVDFNRLDELHQDIKNDIKDEGLKITDDFVEMDTTLRQKVDAIEETFNAMEQEPPSS